jgi:hypothetical protein
MFSFKYTALIIGAQLLLFIVVIVVGSVWQGDALVMVLFILYYPFIALAAALGFKGMMAPIIAGGVVGLPIYGLVIGSILKRFRSGKVLHS